MLKDKPKKGLALQILMGKSNEADEPEVDESKEAMLESAGDVMAAFESKDVEALKTALYDFMELWDSHEKTEKPEEEATEEEEI